LFEPGIPSTSQSNRILHKRSLQYDHRLAEMNSHQFYFKLSSKSLNEQPFMVLKYSEILLHPYGTCLSFFSTIKSLFLHFSSWMVLNHQSRIWGDSNSSAAFMNLVVELLTLKTHAFDTTIVEVGRVAEELLQVFLSAQSPKLNHQRVSCER
jgi:hypothetical protein